MILRKKEELRNGKGKGEKSGKKLRKKRDLECLECDLLVEFFTLFNNFI